MAPAVLERIFEPFFTTKPVNEGTGMGLSVVHGIVQRNEGTITVESVVDEGISFVLRFPVIPPQPKTENVVVASEGERLQGIEHILVVDDEHVLTLDVEMPKMDELTFLEKLMTGHPMPVLMVSSLTEVGCETTLRALELGAVDFFTKPKLDMQVGMDEQAQDLIDKVRAAAQAQVKGKAINGTLREKKTHHVLSSAMIKTTDTIIAIGVSTGGTEALREVLEVLPPNTPPVIITQHMPEKFTKSFADRLNGLCQIEVKEAEDGDSVLPGHALIAPGNYHMTLMRSGARYAVRLSQEAPVNRHRPSVDVMFESVAKFAGGNSAGVILTGMGDDGAAGMLEMKHAGAYTIAQDEASCVVFGMPKEAIKLGGVDKILPLNDIPSALLAAH